MDWTYTHHPEIWGGKPLIYPHVPPEHPKYGQSTVIGNFIFLAGNVGQDMRPVDMEPGPPESIEEQFMLALDAARVR